MNAQEAFAIWAPGESAWSAWAKPVLFSPMQTPVVDIELALPRIGSIPPADGKTCVIVDLPDRAGVEAGLALAQVGYRPIPLYNARSAPLAVIDLAGVRNALFAGAEMLARLSLPDHAAPAFLLDARRRGASTPAPGTFDNRSVSLPTDFPSANVLLASGICRVIVLQETAASPQTDLAHTLRRWQEAGIEILGAGVLETAARSLNIARPFQFRSMFYAFLATLGLKANPLGGFGGVLGSGGGG